MAAFRVTGVVAGCSGRILQSSYRAHNRNQTSRAAQGVEQCGQAPSVVRTRGIRAERADRLTCIYMLGCAGIGVFDLDQIRRPRRALLPPSPAAEKATARQDQAGQSSTGDGTGDYRGIDDVQKYIAGFSGRGDIHELETPRIGRCGRRRFRPQVPACALRPRQPLHSPNV
jgi:hypothetical protein